VYNNNFIEIDSDLNELQEFCNMVVRSHVKEVMLVLITKLTHELAIMKRNCREESVSKLKWTDIVVDRNNILNEVEQLSI
jgi:hypothetical protein